MTSIQGCNSATNLLKMTLYNPNLDLINANGYTKFGLILFIFCQDIEQNEILTSIKGHNSVANVRKTRTVRGSDYSPAIELSEQKSKLVTSTGETEKYSDGQANKVWLNSVYWFSSY